MSENYILVHMMKSLLGLKRYVAKPDEPVAPAETREAPGLYECPTCTRVFISSPDECSNCGSENFEQVDDFERDA